MCLARRCQAPSQIVQHILRAPLAALPLLFEVVAWPENDNGRQHNRCANTEYVFKSTVEWHRKWRAHERVVGPQERCFRKLYQ